MPQVTHACNNHAYVANPPGSMGAQVVARPWAEVIAHHQGLKHRVWCLVDTGADDTILDLGSATVLGITPALLLNQVPVVFGNGASTHYGLARIELDLLGRSANTMVMADVLFGPVTVPLLGRSALLQMTTVIADGGYRGTGLVIPHHRERDQRRSLR